MQAAPLRFGSFISPIHSPHEDPTITIHRDVELIQRMEDWGYDEVWMGEHHSTGWETVGSPEVFLAYVGAKTSRIKLGTGVVSLPYHHPFQAAERIVLLDHLTRGRVIFGIGPGSAAYDAHMIGLEPHETRPLMEEGVEVVLRLLSGERVTYKSKHWELREAAIQLAPFNPNLEIAVTSVISPTGARLAGKYGASILSLNAASAESLKMLRENWNVAEVEAAKVGRTTDRRNWRMVSPMHIAETREQARQDVKRGLSHWIRYNTTIGTLALASDKGNTIDDRIDFMNESGFAVIGDPDDAAAQIRRLQEASGGFGTFLLWGHDWANPTATLRSHELFATEVAPRFRHHQARLVEAEEYALSRREEFLSKTLTARWKARDDYFAKEKSKDEAAAG